MSINPKNSIKQIYYAGGLAELVSSPSLLTYSYIADWFTGSESLGKAMKLLDLPYQKMNQPILILMENNLLVNLEIEEKTLYQKTILSYVKQVDISETPRLSINLTKCIYPINLINTLKILFMQSKCISNPQWAEEKANILLKKIPDMAYGSTIEQVDELLKNNVWPYVLAIGFLNEFYNQLIIKEAKDYITNVNTYISNAIAKKDWLFRSLTDQVEVRKGNLSFSEYINRYGLRADKDYELTCPRWYEIQDVIKKRIETGIDTTNNTVINLVVNSRLSNYIETSITLQLLRSEAKRKALIHVDSLRKYIIQKTKRKINLSHITKEDLLAGKLTEEKLIINATKKAIILPSATTSKGVSVSPGYVTGKTKHITNNNITISGQTIGIFPNASPEFAIQYSKCKGMIFLKGGQTSHGAIVAREFGIPSIIDSKAQDIKDNSKLELNAETGEWRIL